MTDEPRDWEALRTDAIKAVREALPLSSPKAARAVDAILAVIDEECVNRLGAQFIADTKLRAMDFTNGASMEMEPAREVAALWVGAARGLLETAENYSEISMEFKAAGDDQRYAFTCQKVGKLTPHEARRKAEADLERLQQAIRSPVVWLGGLACGMRKVYGANGEDWTLWADNIEKAASELAALLPENQEEAAPAAGGKATG